MTVRKDGLETRHRIITAAANIFAEHGFHETTHAAICEQADVNTAAINYHFGSKADLYVETWKHLEAQADLTHPMDGGVSSGASAEERLRGRIYGLVSRISDRGRMGAIHALRVKEMANPTGLLDETMDAMHRRNHDDTIGVLLEMIGPEATDLELNLCERSIMGQCFMMRPPRGPKDTGISPCSPADIAEHIYRFSMAGIREMCMGSGDAESKAADDSESN